jgi:osmotically-inducible protein OsmY
MRRDRALAAAAWDTLFEARILPRSLVVHARDGCITLEGEVDQLPQAIPARDLVAAVPGVRSVTNLVRMRADGSAGPTLR